MPKIFYSTSEVAALFQVSRVTVYRWVKDGRVKAFGVGKHYKIPAAEVRRMLKQFGFSTDDVHEICYESNDIAAKDLVETLGAHLGES